MKRCGRRRLAWLGVGLGLLLMLPNCGPLSIAQRLLRSQGRRATATVAGHGQFHLVGYSVLMFDSVSIEMPSRSPFPPDEVLRIFSGGREDLFAEDVSIRASEHGIRIHVACHQQPPFDVDVTDDELSLLRWIGPRVVVGGEPRPLWSWLDAVDGLLVLLLCGSLSSTGRRRRHHGEPPAAAELLAAAPGDVDAAPP